MEILFYYRTFAELRYGKDLGFEDPYHILSSLNEKMREAVLNNPSGYSDDETCQIIALDGKKVVGCTNPFGGRMVVKGTVLPVQNGSYLYAHEDYRKENVGGELFFRLSKLHPNKDNLYAGISHMAIGLYKVLNFTVFEFPRFIYLRKSRSVVHALLKTESPLINPLIWITDSALWLHRLLLKGIVNITASRYEIERVEEIPDEVVKIVMDDVHLYKELHDKKWFEWNLHYTFNNDVRNKKRLYVIRNGGKIEAFFLIKQEFFKQASNRGFKDVYLGSVMEWGVDKNSKLTEKLIYLISIGCFDSDIDGIQVATDNQQTAKGLKKFLFVGIGMANMGFKLKSITYPDVKDINNWRVRLATSDTLIN